MVIEISDLEKIAAAIASVLALFGAGSILRRRISRDASGVAHDRAEKSIFSGTVDALTRSRDAWQATAVAATEELSVCRENRRGLEVTVEHLGRDIESMRGAIALHGQQMARLHRRLVRAYPELAGILGSDFGAADLEPRSPDRTG